ncbi:MAG: EI24 domain-containing protein [Rhodospirillales bacterium]
MLITALLRSLTQLGDPKILRVLFLSVLVALGLFILATLLVMWLTSFIPPTGTEWLDEWLSPLINVSTPIAMLIAGYFVFPALVTIGLGFFLDDVMAAVESRHYPKRPATRQVGTIEDLWIGVRLLAVMVVVNIAILPLYIGLLITGIGAPLLYLGVNAYLLGREYFELVSIRHMTRRDMDGKRKEHSLLCFLAGFIIACLFFVPILNFFAPIVGAALMTHVVQRRALPPLRS